MRNGEWGMGNGEWGMGNGEWRMENGEWKTWNGKWENIFIFIKPIYCNFRYSFFLLVLSNACEPFVLPSVKKLLFTNM